MLGLDIKWTAPEDWKTRFCEADESGDSLTSPSQAYMTHVPHLAIRFDPSGRMCKGGDDGGD